MSDLEDNSPLVISRKEEIEGNAARKKDSINWIQALLHIFKANVGTGVMALPFAFKCSGWLLGSLAYILITCIAQIAINQLLWCSGKSRRSEEEKFDYGKLIKVACENSRLLCVQKYADLAKFLVNFILALTQYGFCTVYFVFVAASLVKIFSYFHANIPVTESVIVIVLYIPFLLTVFAKKLKTISYYSTIGVISISISIVIIFNVTVRRPPTDIIRLPKASDQFPIFFGNVLYAIEGIGVVLPVENKMKTRKQCIIVTNIGFGLVFVLYFFFAFLGYNRYGNEIKDSVSLNLEDVMLGEIENILMAVAVFFSFPLQFYVPKSFLYQQLYDKFNAHQELHNKEYRCTADYWDDVLLIVNVALICIAAASLPFLALLMSFIGCIGCALLAIIAPAFLHIIVFDSLHPQMSCRKFAIIAYNIIAIALSMILSGLGMVSVVNEIMKSFQHG